MISVFQRFCCCTGDSKDQIEGDRIKLTCAVEPEDFDQASLHFIRELAGKLKNKNGNYKATTPTLKAPSSENGSAPQHKNRNRKQSFALMAFKAQVQNLNINKRNAIEFVQNDEEQSGTCVEKSSSNGQPTKKRFSGSKLTMQRQASDIS